MIYFVREEGVFGHDIFGTFDSVEEAETFALEKLQKEHDDYHSFSVNFFDENKEEQNITLYSRKDLHSENKMVVFKGFILTEESKLFEKQLENK